MRDVDVIQPMSEVDCILAPRSVWQAVEDMVSRREPGKLASLGMREVGKPMRRGWLTVQTFYRCLAWDIPMRHYFALVVKGGIT